MALQIRHIQDPHEANTTTQHHWAYPDRVLPCTKDVGTCQYLDAVYRMHDTSMLYTFILWGVILGVLLVWSGLRLLRTLSTRCGERSVLDRLSSRIAEVRRRWLLVHAPLPSIFGHVSRLQVAVLAVVLAYLLIFSLVGITYKTWITPIKKSTLHNTRTGLGGWSDRIGALAYALTPFTVMLGMRESILSLATGIPYQHFTFLHRWLGRIIFIQAFFHTLGWTLVEGRFYQPQPAVYVMFLKEQYIIFGIVAMFLITLMLILSTERAIAWTGYAVFKVVHWVLALLYIGACWGHWDKLACWMIPSLVLIFVDQGLRYLSMIWIHGRRRSGNGPLFQPATANVTLFDHESAGSRSSGKQSDVLLRLDVSVSEEVSWKAGQHYHLTFPGLSLWHSHPLTIASLPNQSSTSSASVTEQSQIQTYLIRIRSGQTKKLAALAAKGVAKIPAVLSGPHGREFPSRRARNILAIAGGSGVSFTLPIVLQALRQRQEAAQKRGEKSDDAVLERADDETRIIDFVWVVRNVRDLLWIPDELLQIRKEMDKTAGLRVRIYITRSEREQSLRECSELPTTPSSSSSSGARVEDEKHISTICTDIREVTSPDASPREASLEELLNTSHPRFSITFLQDRRPEMAAIVHDFDKEVNTAGGSGSVQILGSGPQSLGADLRRAVANSAGIGGARFYWDGRE